MADNITLATGTIAFDDISSVWYQRVKATWGADGTANDVSASDPLPVNPTPATSGGLTIERVISAASTNATSVKASAGQVYGLVATNINASPVYLKFYNKASAPTVGTDTPVITLAIPGNTAGAGLVMEFGHGIPFGTGIALALTTGAADSDTGAVSANENIVNLFYK